ncbi:MAG TPA: acetylxylan esterase [Armatimonadota bacterium]|jgi:cephalosporin-C deacetylase-like acetyl esterase
MTHNLYSPYGAKSSPPRCAELCFFSKESDDLLFGEQDEITLYCRAGLRSVAMQWTLARNFFTTPFQCGVAEATPNNTYIIRIPTAGLHPGFYDLRVSLDTGEDEVIAGVSTFGYRADAMPILDTRPADFVAFWDTAKATLAQTPPDARETFMRSYAGKEIDAYNRAHAALPGDYDPTGHRSEEVEAYKVDFQSVNGLRIHGWLAKPKGPGPFPTMLVLPGAGFAARPIPLEHARHGYLALDLQVHGQEVDLAEYPRLPGYYDEIVYAPVTEHYYYQVHLNCIQAVNYLTSRSDVDPARIVVAGGSQGGRLSVVMAGLDSRIAAAIPAIAHFANIPYLDWAEASNAQGVAGMDIVGTPAQADTPKNRCIPYYDIMNFAPDVRCPVLMNAGFIDPCSLMSGVYATYLRLASADKTLIPLPGMAHDWSAEFDRRAWRWLDERLG